MNEKRFTQKDEDDWEIFENGEHFAFAHSGYNAKKIIETLNVLSDKLDCHILLTDQERQKASNFIKGIEKENEQLKKDATILIYSNQDYRQENENLKKQLDYIQNSINEHIKHQKTELGQKALQEIIEDYNEWLLGHKEMKE